MKDFCRVCGLYSEQRVCESCKALCAQAAQAAIDDGIGAGLDHGELSSEVAIQLAKMSDVSRATIATLPVTFIRARRTVGSEPAAHYPPKVAGHSSAGSPCIACGWPMLPGQSTALVVLGPGRNFDAREACAAGRKYDARAIELHADCAGITSREGAEDV